MSLKKLISSYTRYNHWANEKMTQWLETLERNLLYKETPSSFGSIDLTLQHMNHAQNFWFAIITGTDVAKLDETIKLNAVDIVIDELLAGSQRMLDKFTTYTEEELSTQVPSQDMMQSRYDYILHAINHNSYHRGQIVTMIRCLGLVGNVPAMDYEVFLWTGRASKDL
ncbi:MAG TPA: DinB family protein [Chryseolinea sp.]